MRRRNPTPPKNITPTATPAPASNKWSDLAVRVGSSILLIAIELTIIAAGHVAIFAEIFILQYVVVYELMAAGRKPEEEKKIPLFTKAFPYILTTLISYAVSAPGIVEEIIGECSFMKYHALFCFFIGSILLVLFVISLNPVNLAYSFDRLGWSIVSVVLLVVPANLYVKVSRFSLFWFFNSVCAVALNDSCAYFCGRIFGHTPLIALSPKKTVEGFVGALFCCVAISFFLPILFSKFPFTYCENVKPFAFHTECNPPPEFVKQQYNIFGFSFEAFPAQLHSIVFYVFSSLIAPFGGFLASGLKRVHGLKDFGNVIPGHGGILDRVDCEFIMATFAYLYIKSVIRN
ncbi:Phosphatidate cytidylyltransferase [Histomonas meleagridis]|uniref:Phosphatidate cytidylyltransferase n=1 Tax=Histomonas meleagridis TaxID=135588 RepID=UPI003559AA24|nr:Phosphatidate cytidylyltransferase [Histomonas meleagridis]KAH0801960.1 Phosphatidate cytidylyltransferase [Histomonas meleagridis]